MEPALVDLLGGLLRPCDSERLTIDQVLDHPWVQEPTSRALAATPLLSESRCEGLSEGYHIRCIPAPTPFSGCPEFSECTANCNVAQATMSLPRGG